jgi:hypothetical protein
MGGLVSLSAMKVGGIVSKLLLNRRSQPALRILGIAALLPSRFCWALEQSRSHIQTHLQTIIQ